MQQEDFESRNKISEENEKIPKESTLSSQNEKPSTGGKTEGKKNG